MYYFWSCLTKEPRKHVVRHSWAVISIMMLLLIIPEQGRTFPMLRTSVQVTFFKDWFGELLVSSMISQHHTLKFRVFISRLYITRAISSPTCECTDWGERKTVESLACLQGWLSNVELLPLACYKIPSFPLHKAMVRLSETTLTLGEKRTSEPNIASRIIPTVWKPLPQGYILSPTSHWSQKDSSWEQNPELCSQGTSWWPGSLLLIQSHVVLSGLWRICLLLR